MICGAGDGRDSRRASTAWLVLGVASASATEFPFPQGPYGGVQAFFNTAHAALLGYEAVTCTAIVALLAYLLARGLRRPPSGGTARPTAIADPERSASGD